MVLDWQNCLQFENMCIQKKCQNLNYDLLQGCSHFSKVFVVKKKKLQIVTVNSQSAVCI